MPVGPQYVFSLQTKPSNLAISLSRQTQPSNLAFKLSLQTSGCSFNFLLASTNETMTKIWAHIIFHSKSVQIWPSFSTRTNFAVAPGVVFLHLQEYTRTCPTPKRPV